MKTFQRSLLSILFLSLFPFPALAVEWNNLRVDSMVKPAMGYLGDPLRLEIVVDHDKGIGLYYPESTYNINPFEIMKIEMVEGALSPDTTRTRISYVITTYKALGEMVIPPLQIVAKDNLGGKKLITVANHKVQLKTMIKDENAQLMDIYTPLEPEREIPVALLIYILGGLLAVGAFLFLLARFARRSATGSTPTSSMAPREKALEALRGLPMDETQKKLLYFHLSNIFRAFVEEHLRISALKRTSAEILSDFEKNNLLNGGRDAAGDLFFDLDLVKFSSFDPTRQEMETAVQRTCQLIREIP